MAARCPTFVVLGSTGDGKSSLCNVLSGKNPLDTNFPVGHRTHGETYATTSKHGKWLGVKDMCLIDTPGLDDPEGRDNEHIKALTEALVGIKEVNTFLIVLNGTKPRFDKGLQLVMEMFTTMFGDNFMKNAVVVFTKWSFSNSDIKKRKRQGITEKGHSDDWEQKFYELFNVANVPIVYVDAMHDNEIPEELAKFTTESEKVWYAMTKMQPYDCTDVKAAKRQLDQEKDKYKALEKQLKEATKEAAAQRKARSEEQRERQNPFAAFMQGAIDVFTFKPLRDAIGRI